MQMNRYRWLDYLVYAKVTTHIMYGFLRSWGPSGATQYSQKPAGSVLSVLARRGGVFEARYKESGQNRGEMGPDRPSGQMAGGASNA